MGCCSQTVQNTKSNARQQDGRKGVEFSRALATAVIFSEKVIQKARLGYTAISDSCAYAYFRKSSKVA